MTTRSFLIVLHTFMIVFHLGSSEGMLNINERFFLN